MKRYLTKGNIVRYDRIGGQVVSPPLWGVVTGFTHRTPHIMVLVSGGARDDLQAPGHSWGAASDMVDWEDGLTSRSYVPDVDVPDEVWAAQARLALLGEVDE